MNYLRNTFVGVGFAYLQIVIGLVQGLIVTPLCLAHIPEATYGAWLVTGNVLAWIGLVDPGFHVVIQQRIAAAHAAGDMSMMNRLRLQAYVISALLGCGAVLVAIMVMPLYSIIVSRLGCEHPGQAAAAYLLASLSLAIFIASYGAAVVTVGRQAPAVHGVLGLLGQVCHLVVVVVCLEQGFGIASLPIGLLAQAIIVLGGNLTHAVVTMPSIRWQDPAWLEGCGVLLQDTRGVLMSRVGATLAANSDMLIASWFLGAAPTVGVNVTNRAPLMFRMLTERVSHAAMPSLSSINAAEKGVVPATAAAAVIRASIWMALPAALGVILWNGLFVGLWVGDGYYLGHSMNLLLAFGLLAASLEATMVNVCMAFGLYAVSGRLLLAKSILSIGFGILGAFFAGVGGLLVAPLIAGGLTTWWLLPRAVSSYSGWDRLRWRVFLVDAIKGCAAAAAAAIIASTIPVGDVGKLVIAGVAFVLVYAVCLACFSSDFRLLVCALRPWLIRGLKRT